MLTVNQLTGFGVGGGGAAIQFVGGAIAGKAGAASGNSTIPLNSGLTGGIASAAQSGDFVLAVFATGSAADRTLSITDGSADYTLIGSELYENHTLTDTNFRVAYKFITSDTDTTFGPTLNGFDAGAMSVLVFRNVDTASPLDVTPTTAQANTNVDINYPSITPATPGAVLVFVGAGSGQSTDTPTEPGGQGWEYFEAIYQSDTYGTALGVAVKTDWSSGAVDPSALNMGDRNSMCAMSIALRPAS